ncbi:MAG: VIT1/CCC1 transporter family protein [Candidatus Micrarchaeota archaeon]|nr:VIT1/CCC1 transporter family protein [Candidatus Micrarchaeota archaeon]
MANGKERYIEQLYRGEMLHKEVYARLAGREKNQTLRSLLLRLAKIEGDHVTIWGRLLDTSLLKPDMFKISFMTAFISFVRSFLGLALTVKIIEYGETELKARLNKALSMPVNRKQREVILKLEHGMDSVEDPLQQQIIEYSPVLRNIRDVIFGMNDGLVEVLAAVAGFGAALQQPTLVLLAGFIVAVSGTLSMAGGAYLSTEYEKSIKVEEGRGRSSAKLSAVYVGLFYIIGAAFPLLPFALGFGGYYGIIGSIIITAIVLTIVSSLISVVSDTSIARRVARTLSISLGIAAVTIIIGVIARHVLHLVV